MDQIKILIAEDQSIIRMAFAFYLHSYNHIEVVAEAANGLEMIEKYKATLPDIVLCDINMPLMDGLHASKKILQEYKDAKIIMVTAYNDNDYLSIARNIGAAGYMDKNVSLEDLKFAVEHIAAGGKYFLGKTETELEEERQMSYNDADKISVNPAYQGLTQHEKEILVLIAKGMTNTEIAERLKLNRNSVEFLRNHLVSKLNLKSTSQLIRYAIEFTAGQNGNGFSAY
ncbi:MAG: hypothetical protein CVV24_10270 [Ignavibacteriae bacterium HGW-Ignavibacteriae-3]|nr:MAG: hypothetical protein CVV24_10270 [Ignavibacteriae bacterium HGW-Ignavibacteriae-3]